MIPDQLVQAAAAELTTPECPWHDTCAGACEAAQVHARAVLNAVRPVLLAEVDGLRAQIGKVRSLADALDVTEAEAVKLLQPLDLIAQSRKADEIDGRRSVARALRRALGLDQNKEGQSNG